MEYPEIGLNVLVTLDTGEEKIGYWTGDIWMQGVDDNPTDIQIDGNVVSWRNWN